MGHSNRRKLGLPVARDKRTSRCAGPARMIRRRARQSHGDSPMSSGPETPIHIVHKHHPLVRLTHWVNVPLLVGLTVSGLSIYWAAPVFLHRPDPVTHSMDYLRDAGLVVARVLPDRTS